MIFLGVGFLSIGVYLAAAPEQLYTTPTYTNSYSNNQPVNVASREPQRMQNKKPVERKVGPKTAQALDAPKPTPVPEQVEPRKVWPANSYNPGAPVQGMPDDRFSKSQSPEALKNCKGQVITFRGKLTCVND